METIKVTAGSKTVILAGALAEIIKKHRQAELQALGPEALNQAVKAIAIARDFVAPRGLDLVFTPALADVQIYGEMRPAIKLRVKTREAD